jgi:glutathione synthase/RimK-type ligase-like ATP-grasp enzyme
MAPHDTDLVPLVQALEVLGVAPTVVDWHEAGTDWSAFDLAVIRSTWDYTGRLDEFLARMAEVAAHTVLANPLPVVRANAEKGYLLDLAAAGVPVVPTTVLRPGDRVEVPDGVEVVVKPTVSAGARDTARYAPADRAEAEAHAALLLGAGRSVLVQPYVPSVEELGETGLVYLTDRFSHGFRKEPLLVDRAAPVDRPRDAPISPRTPSDAEREVAEAALDALGAMVAGADRRRLLYARVDLVRGPGGPMLMELELIEPSLYLHVDPASPARTAAAILEHLSVG